MGQVLLWNRPCSSFRLMCQLKMEGRLCKPLIFCEGILLPQPQYFPHICSILSLWTSIFCEGQISFTTTLLYMEEIQWFTVVLLERQKVPCGIIEKRFCKEKKLTTNNLQKHRAQPEASCSLCESGVTRKTDEFKRTEVRADEENRPFSLVKTSMCMCIYPKALRRGFSSHQCHQLPHTLTFHMIPIIRPQNTFIFLSRESCICCQHISDLISDSGLPCKLLHGIWQGFTSLHTINLLPSLFGQAATVLSTHPQWASAFYPTSGSAH